MNISNGLFPPFEDSQDDARIHRKTEYKTRASHKTGLSIMHQVLSIVYFFMTCSMHECSQVNMPYIS